MNWSNVKLILSREIRDQLRDRRTLFMIFVLPILLYPLLGMSLFQVTQFIEQKPSSVLIVGAGSLADLPALVENQRFAARLFNHSNGGESGAVNRVGLLELHFAPDEPRGPDQKLPDQPAEARLAIQMGRYDAAVYFPPDFAERLQAFRKALRVKMDAVEERAGEDGEASLAAAKKTPSVPRPEIIYTTANEKSQVAFARLFGVLERWRQEIVNEELAKVGLPTSATRPFDVRSADVAEATGLEGAAIWSKVLPILLLVWAMTGAFYPAIDLCAGEKERGTLETLLSSPAERSEIVLGKLVAIMLFSMATAALNLISMGVTGWLLLAQLPQFGPPSATAILWLSIALVPVSALFSALCLALAAFARSTKEGQYYLMPLLLVTMPLVILPMAPGVELNLGNSLIPVTGVVLLLRSMLEGNFWIDWPFALPVAAVTLACSWLSIRWAVEQFNSESVLFREGERLDVGLWLRHLLADRRPTPTVAAAVSCGVVILFFRFFLSLSVAMPENFRGLAVLALVTQLAVIAAPALLMTMALTTSPRQTLLLRRPAWVTLPAAAALAIVLHPSVAALGAAVTSLYPISQETQEALNGMFTGAPGFWQLVLIVAVAPAICEELAFRGFILSGFRHLGHKWRAIFYSALFFGLSHAILQQQIVACLVGVVIGMIAVQTGSVLPGILFHLIHNTLQLVAAQAAAQITPQLLDRWPALRWLVSPSDDGMMYRWPVVVASGLAAFAILVWFGRLSYSKSSEEKRYEALHRASETED